MGRISAQGLAQVSIGILLLVIIRSLGEYFRLRYLYGDALAVPQVTPYIAGALFTAVALVLTVISYFATRYRVSTAIAAAAVVVLLVYKVAVVG